jgi:hypothetical protein
MQTVWLILGTLILDVPAKVGFGFLLLSNQTLQEAGAGGGTQVSRVP